MNVKMCRWCFARAIDDRDYACSTCAVNLTVCARCGAPIDGGKHECPRALPPTRPNVQHDPVGFAARAVGLR